MPALPKALLCDLDDTIIEYEVHADSSWTTTCKDICRQLPGITPQRLFDAILESRTAFWADPVTVKRGRMDLPWSRNEVVSQALASLKLTDPALAESIVANYARTRDAAVKPFDGALDTLRWLTKQGVRLALLTNGNGKGQREKIERFNLSQFFDMIWIEGERGVGKPDHRVFNSVLKAFAVVPGDAWMIGDNLLADVAPAQHLGIHDIWVDWAGKGLPSSTKVKPTRRVRSIAELGPSG